MNWCIARMNCRRGSVKTSPLFQPELCVLSMWTCNNCREIVEDQFDACWNCGCSREGKLNLDFLPRPIAFEDETSLEQTFAEEFRCQKCQHRDARVERITGRGTGFGKMFAKDFLAVSCQNCGYTEFFNLSVLQCRSGLQDFLRGLFGG